MATPHYYQKTEDTKFERYINMHIKLPTTAPYLVPDFNTGNLGRSRSYNLEFLIRYANQPREPPCLKALKGKLGLGSLQHYRRGCKHDNNNV